MYHGPLSEVVGFFESCGFKCPDRKAVPDFLQEVTSRKDQQVSLFSQLCPWSSSPAQFRRIDSVVARTTAPIAYPCLHPIDE